MSYFNACDRIIVSRNLSTSQIVLTIEDDVDVGIWLEVVGENAKLGRRWTDMTVYAALDPKQWR